MFCLFSEFQKDYAYERLKQRSRSRGKSDPVFNQ